MKMQVEYSEGLGRSRNFLSMYRHSRKIPTSVDADGLCKAYLEEKQSQEALMLELQAMYYDLKECRKLTAFSDYLIAQGIMRSRTSFQSFTIRYFYSTERIRDKNFITKHRGILALYKEWK